MEDRLDLVLLGATGFTGTRCIPYLYNLTRFNGRSLTWGVAGRSRAKLEEVLLEAGKKIGVDLEKVPIIIVDIENAKSLEAMASGAKVVLNCSGPFGFLGEKVVKACIEAGTHHVDISAEPQFMEKLELDLKDEARSKEVYVVTACGFDCLPADLGAVFLQQQFQGTLNSINTYLDVWLQDGDKSKNVIGYSSNSIMNSGTWESLIWSVANWQEILQIRKKLFPEAMSKFLPEVKQRFMPHHCETVEGWCIPLPTADGSSIKRTQKHFYEVEKQRPIQASTYFNIKSIFRIFLVVIFLIMLYPLTRCKFGIRLLLRYPGLFTLGMFRKEPPKEEQVRNTWYQVTLHGEGWEDQVGPDEYEYHKKCDKSIVGRVKGRDGYEITCIGVVLSAVVILSEKEKLPEKGGVFSAGACFSKTSLIQQLMAHGVEFKILHQKKL